MPEEMWLRFSEAVALVRELRGFNVGKSTGTVNRAIATGDIERSFTEQYIINEEKQAHQELYQSAQRDAAARGFKMSGSMLDILRSDGQKGAYKRVGQRLRLLNDVGSPEFNEQLVLGNIRVSRGDLIEWLDQPAQAAANDRQKPERDRPRRNPSKEAAVAIWGEAGPPDYLSNGEICTAITKKLEKAGQKTNLPSNSTMLRAVERKS